MAGVVNIELNKTDIAKLEKELQRINDIRFEAVVKKNVTQMLNTARAGGTPVSTEETRPGGPHGKLRESSGVTGDEMGYIADYAFRLCGACKTGQKRQKLSLRVA